MKEILGKLEKVEDLRSVWKNEASDFTKWLAKEENIALLSEELGFPIVVDETEASAGRYNVDIRAHDEDTEKTIIIENQLEMTNHDHLGKVIVYSAGLDAEIQIWIVKDVREEHKQAVDWLNEHSDEHVNIFLLKIELWKIDDSKVAPKFQIISSPNNWAKTIRQNVEKNLSNTNVAHLNFWEGFKEYCAGKVNFTLYKPSFHPWYDVPMNKEYHVVLRYSVPKQEISCELYISNNKELYSRLESRKEEIEAEIGDGLVWIPMLDKKACRIKLPSSLTVKPDAEDNSEAFEWLKEKTELFMRVFPKYI